MRPAFLACLIAFAVPGGAAGPRLVAWPVDALEKVFPSDPPPAVQQAPLEVWTARNRHLNLQIALRAREALDGLSVACSPVVGPAGALAADVRARMVGLVVVGSHTRRLPEDERIGEAPGWYPDPLIDWDGRLEPERTRSISLSVFIPRGAVPGPYRLEAVVRREDQVLARVLFRVHVSRATVPDERTLQVTNWFRTSDRSMRQFYDAPRFSERWWAVVGNFAAVMAVHRQNVVLTPVLDLAELSPGDGAPRFGFDRFDRWVETFQQAGAIGLIEGGHLVARAGGYDEPLVVPILGRGPEQVEELRLPLDDPRVEPFLVAFLSALDEHLEKRGWKGIYRQHILDEPHGDEPAAYARVAALVHRHLPGVPTIDAIDAKRIPPILQEASDIWVPLLGRFDGRMDLLRRRQRAGHEVWFYTCLFPRGPYMNRLLDMSLLKARLLHWLGFRHGLTGFLHWGWNAWTPEPTHATQAVINLNQTLLPGGDAFIVYPDRKGLSVHPSIRLEAMREGIEDYEMLVALARRDRAAADALAREAVASFTDYVRDTTAFRRIERVLLEELATRQP